MERSIKNISHSGSRSLSAVYGITTSWSIVLTSEHLYISHGFKHNTQNTMVILLELPREIRDIIWTQCSTTDSMGLNFDGGIRCPRSDFPCRNSTFALLSTCNIVHDELARYLYGRPLFHFVAPHTTLEWMRFIGTRHSSLIRRICIRIASWHSMYNGEQEREIMFETWAKVLRAAPSLQELTLDHHGGSPDWGALAFDPRVSPSFARVVKSLSNLQHLSYLDARSFDLTLLKNIPQLRTFRITDQLPAIVPRHDTSLDGLEALQLGRPFADRDPHTPPWNWRGKASHKLLSSSSPGCVSSGPLPRVKGHQSLPDIDVTVLCDLSGLNFELAIATCYPCPPRAPDLVYFEFQVGDYSAELTRVPQSVRYLAISMVLPGVCAETEKHLHDMMLRCTNLISLEIGVYEPPLIRTESSILDLGNPVRQVLEEMHSKGISVHLSVQRTSSRWRATHNQEHVDQSGLIP